jgi:hypothetical protein
VSIDEHPDGRKERCHPEHEDKGVGGYMEDLAREPQDAGCKEYPDRVDEVVGRYYAALFLGPALLLKEGVQGHYEQAAGEAEHYHGRRRPRVIVRRARKEDREQPHAY